FVWIPKGCVSLGTTSNRWLKRPPPNAARRCLHLNPRPRSALLLLRPHSVGRFASLSAKKYGTPYFSARKRTSKYSRSCSQSLAELLRLRKAGALRFICVIRRGASAIVGWKRFTCRRVAASFRFILPASRTHPLRPQPQERQQLPQINQPLGLVPLRINQRRPCILLVEQLRQP